MKVFKKNTELDAGNAARNKARSKRSAAAQVGRARSQARREASFYQNV